MSGRIRQCLGPTRKRLKDRIKQSQTFLQQDIALDEREQTQSITPQVRRKSQILYCKKHPLAKNTKLKASDWKMKFSILALDGDEAICDLKTLLMNIAKRKQETTEKAQKQIEGKNS